MALSAPSTLGLTSIFPGSDRPIAGQPLPGDVLADICLGRLIGQKFVLAMCRLANGSFPRPAAGNLGGLAW